MGWGWAEDLGSRFVELGKDLGETVTALPGLVWDGASWVLPGDQPFSTVDDKNSGWFSGGDVSSLGAGAMGRVGQVLAPLTDSENIIGPVTTPVLNGLSWANHEILDRPLSTVMTMASHLDSGGGPTHYGDLFNGDAWAQAYEIADHQSFGQSAVYAVTNEDDPFKDATVGPSGSVTGTPFENVTAKDHPNWAPLAALATDFAVSWKFDPAVVAGKGLGRVREHNLGTLTTADRADLETTLADAAAGDRRGRSLVNRNDKFVQFIGGDNRLGRPLVGPEIHATSVELGRSAEGKAIASQLGEAMKLPDAASREVAARNIIAVAAGDPGAIARLQGQVAGGRSIADALNNITSKSTDKSMMLSLRNTMRNDPEFRAHMNTQVTNLDDTGEISAYLKKWSDETRTQLKSSEQLMTTQGTLDNLPGVHSNSNAKLASAVGQGKLDRMASSYDSLIGRASGGATRADFSGVFQRGIYNVALTVAHSTLGVPMKLPAAFVRNLGAVRYSGVASLHDWNGATDQLDTLMRLGEVPDAVRIQELANAGKAFTEADRARAIERVEQVAMDHLATHLGSLHGVDIDRAFLSKVMQDGQTERGMSLAALKGQRIYAAGAAPDDLALRMQSAYRAQRAGDYADMTAAQAAKARREVVTDSKSLRPQADMILDDSGQLVSLPLFSSQLGNSVPMIDIARIKKLGGDAAYVQRLAEHSKLYQNEVMDLPGLQGTLKRLQAEGRTSHARLVARTIERKRYAADRILEAANASNRWWKLSVLFRLGYPLRVVTDDHLRIMSKIGYAPFMAANLGEGVKNIAYNMFGRNQEALSKYSRMQGDRALLRDLLGKRGLGSNDITPADVETLRGHVQTFMSAKATKAERATAEAAMRKLDPDGYVLEHYEITKQLRDAAASLAGHRGQVTRLHNLTDTITDPAELGLHQQRISKAEANVSQKQARHALLAEQADGLIDPLDLRAELDGINELLSRGRAATFSDARKGVEKRRVGERSFELKDGTSVPGVYEGTAASLRNNARSDQIHQQYWVDGEKKELTYATSGGHQTISPTQAESGAETPGYLDAWANVLNHQFLNSPEMMSFVKGKVNTPEEFAAWIRDPENSHLVHRMEHFSKDPEAWGSRIQSVFSNYTQVDKTPKLVEALRNGRVTPKQLEKMFPNAADRPTIHGRLADVNTGRSPVMRRTTGTLQRMFGWLADQPTDVLSRHPYMNAIYRREIQKAYDTEVAYAAKTGQQFTGADIDRISRQARVKALGELKRTLWDVSAHSNMAQILRFVSPFFAAHQESLSRWWEIAQDHPQVIRRYQLVFDAPARAGLVYDPNTGEVSKVGDGIGGGKRILLRLPGAEGSAANKWIKKLGGDKFFSINENGLNLILQNGIANPGTGPVVSIPMEALAQQYADKPSILATARILNQYPPQAQGWVGITESSLTPGWARNLLPYIEHNESIPAPFREVAKLLSQDNTVYAQRFQANLSDALIAYQQANNGAFPPDAQMDALMKVVGSHTNVDLFSQAVTNVAGFTPAKAGSKYFSVQQGLQRIREQATAQGEDLDWVRDQFRTKYGQVYMPMLNSLTSNAARLDQTAGEVSAIKRHQGLLANIDPSLQRMVIGAEAAMDAQADPAMGRYSDAARNWLREKTVNPYSDETYISDKSPEQMAARSVIGAGWDQYSQAVDYLELVAHQQGLNTYEDSPDLVAKKQAIVAYLKTRNEAWAHDYSSFSGSNFDSKLDDMKQIATNKGLASDPLRQDVKLLGQYLTIREAFTGELAQRENAGGAKTMDAKSNADLAQQFYRVVQYLNGQSTWFRQFMYESNIEFDPYLKAGEAAGG